MNHGMQTWLWFWSFSFLLCLNTSFAFPFLPVLFSPFLSLTNQGKHKMALLGEQLVMSVCKIETGKVSPPALLPRDSSCQNYWASITFSCIFHLYQQQGDEALGDIFLSLGPGEITCIPQTPILTDKACRVGVCLDAWSRGCNRHETGGSIKQLDDLSSSVLLSLHSLFGVLENNLRSCSVSKRVFTCFAVTVCFVCFICCPFSFFLK